MSISIGKYVSSLLPSFEKSQIEEDLRILKDDLINNTIPAFDNASQWFGEVGYTSTSVKELEKLFKRQINVERKLQGHLTASIHNVLQRTMENITVVEAKVEKLFGRDVAAEGMTYARANVLRFIEVMSFSVKYARKLLFWIYHEEKSRFNNATDTPLTPAEQEWLTRNQLTFIRALTIIARKPKELEATFLNIPDMVVVPAEAEAAEKVMGTDKLDPLNMGLVPIKMNPIYHIRMAITEYQINRYKVAKEENRALEYRLLALKGYHRDRADAKLEQEIEYTENRIQKLNHRIAKMEEG